MKMKGVLWIFLLLIWLRPSEVQGHGPLELSDSPEAQALAELLKKSGNHDPRPPIVVIPGVLGTRMVAWKKKKCIGPDINIQGSLCVFD